MIKNTIRLTEKKLNQIIRESVKNILNEDYDFINDIDITKIPIEILRRGYFDYRIVPISTMYGNVLYEPCYIKEAVFDILPPDEVVNGMINKYNLPPQLVLKREHHHNIYVYVITALIGENAKLVEDDMSKIGYFLSKKGKVAHIQEMKFQALQFEPLSQLQEDITDELKSKFDVLYHWTPSYCVNGILNDGLIPNYRNSVFNYPPRVYLMEGGSSDAKRIRLGRILCASNNNPQNNGSYALLTINITNLDESIRFYYDPNSEIGVYTEQTIPKDVIKIDEIINFKKTQNEQP